VGKLVYIIGESGSGKSTSIRTLNPQETYIINICNKDLPFPGSASMYQEKSENNPGNLFFSNEYRIVGKLVDAISERRPEIKTLIIDDFGYLITHQIFASATDKGYDRFTLIAKCLHEFLEKLQMTRQDLYIFLMWHTDQEENKVKLKSFGKMIDSHSKPEGMPAIILHTQIVDGKFKFLTQNDGVHLAKSPLTMFEDTLIDNDLKIIIERMKQFYNKTMTNPETDNEI